MKKNLLNISLVLAIIACSNSGFSQNFVDTAKTWNILQSYWLNPQYANLSTYQIKYGKDTTLYGKTYRELLVSTDTLFSNWSSWQGYQRDSAGIVYGTNGIYEWIEFDFNLDSGDFFTPNNIDTGFVDSIVYLPMFGNLVKNIYFKGGAVWNEEIGDMKLGPIYQNFATVPEATHELLCFHKNNQLGWMDTDTNTCGIWGPNSVEEKRNTIQDITIFPNPNMNRKLKLSTQVEAIEIFDMSGKLLFAKSMKAGMNEVQLENLKPGIYFLQITKDGQRQFERLILK